MKGEERLHDQPSSAKEGTTQEPWRPLSSPAPFSPAGGCLKLHQGHKAYEMAAVTIPGLRGFGTNSFFLMFMNEVRSLEGQMDKVSKGLK